MLNAYVNVDLSAFMYYVLYIAGSKKRVIIMYAFTRPFLKAVIRG